MLDLKLLSQFMGDELEGVITHHLNGTFVLRQGVVESHLVRGQALVFSSWRTSTVLMALVW